jgi:hypothetical protein
VRHEFADDWNTPREENVPSMGFVR